MASEDATVEGNERLLRGEKIAEWSDSDGYSQHVIERHETLADITLYWLTNTGASSSGFGITVFPREIYRASESWSR